MKVSVVMSVYNADRYVKGSVESILGQTFSDLEFIIINDGSTDGSGEILSSFHDPRIKLIHQKNQGLIRSLNTGVRMARGEYIARQDADDLSLPERIEKQVAFLDTHKNVALVGTASVHMTEYGKDVKVYRLPLSDEEIKKALINNDIPINHGSMMCRRKVIEEAGCYREKLDLVEDYDLYFRIGENHVMANLEEPLYKSRVHSSSVCAVNRFEINRRYELVRKLAEERRVKGKDSLADMTEADIDKFLKAGLPAWSFDKRRTLARNRLFLAEGLYLTRSFTGALSKLGLSIMTWPFSLRAWVLLLKLFVAWAVPQKSKDA